MREVQKSLPPETLCAQQAADMAQINALAKREMTPEEVYTFSVRLCDNEIDRDGERFDEQTLRELAALVNRGVEMLRVGVIAGLLLLVVMYGAKERPAIRPPYYVQYQMNKVERQAVRLQGRVLNIFTKERSS